LPARAAQMGEYFLAKLQELVERYPKYLAHARGKGLLIGLEFQSRDMREQVQNELFHRGVLVAATMNANCTIRIEPPLIITELQVNLMIDKLESILQALEDGDFERRAS
jgi:putrescine aminotransferase